LKIAFFTDTYLPQLNGVSITMHRLFGHLDQRNDIEYLVFAPTPGEQTDNKIVRLPSIKFFLYPECRISVPIFSRIAKTLDNFKPDKIHISTPFGIGIWGLFYAKKRVIPVTAVYHTNYNMYLHYYHLKALDGLLWKYLSWFHNNCDINYCPSDHTRNELSARGIKNLKLWVRGVDTDFFTPQYRGMLSIPYYHINGKIILLYVGRVAAEKNIRVLMRAMELINRSYSNKVHLFIVGDGPMLEQVERWGPVNVTCTGYLSGEKLAKIYANADIFVFPSTTETFGNVVLEAMASGLPVVGASCCGVGDTLLDGVNGISCKPDDPVSLANGVTNLIRNESLRRLLGKQAHTYALSRSLEAGFMKLIKDWEELFCKETPYDSKESPPVFDENKIEHLLAKRLG
jgi:glycosyltransferase involved in cell wall biosynthesis